MKTTILAFLALVSGLFATQVEPCGPKQSQDRSTISSKEVDAWISFFNAKFQGKGVTAPATKLATSDICSYFPASGLHEILPEGSEQLYSMQVYVVREKKTFRYMFLFAAAERVDPTITSLPEFFAVMKITKYYVARVDDSKNTNPVENIIKNGRTDHFDIKH